MHSTPENTFQNLAGLEPRSVDWLWPGRIPLGHLTLIAGDPGVGKSTLATDIAARTSAAIPWPDAAQPQDAPTESAQLVDGFPLLPAQVIYLSAQEDLKATLLPRLKASGACMRRIIATNQTPDVDACLREINALVSHLNDCRLVILDPLAAYLRHFESSRGCQARSVLDQLLDLASNHNMAILGLAYKTRSRGGREVSRLTTSVAINAAARSIWTVNVDPRSPQHLIVTSAKTSLAQTPNAVRFQIMSAPNDTSIGRINWDDKQITPEDLAGMRVSAGQQHDPEVDHWLLSKLKSGPVPTGQLKRMALQDGFSWSTVRRARVRLRITAAIHHHESDASEKWMWFPPSQAGSPAVSKAQTTTSKIA